MNIESFFNYNKCINIRILSQILWSAENAASIKRTERWVIKNGLAFSILNRSSLVDEHGRLAKKLVANEIIHNSRKKRSLVLFASLHSNKGKEYLVANDGRYGRRWVYLGKDLDPKIILQGLIDLVDHENKDIVFLPTDQLVRTCRKLVSNWESNETQTKNGNNLKLALEIYSHGKDDIKVFTSYQNTSLSFKNMNHLDHLEAEAIHIIREAVSQADSPAMLYSIGKDSSVMLHLAKKAFFPSRPPFPLLHVDTGWKFQAMYDFRDFIVKESGMDLLVHINQEGVDKNINPLTHGSAIHTDIMKTQSLKKALDLYKFDVTFGGARRDEEKSRSKERIFSFRNKNHRWDPKNQRPELWKLFNCQKGPKENIRVFPLSNWTELDIWLYIYRENIPIVPLYFAQERPVVNRDDMLLMIDDNRLKLYKNEKIIIKKVRFRTLGCYPLTGAFESNANNLESIILELLVTKTSERQGRTIDSDTSSSMEKKKEEGYF